MPVNMNTEEMPLTLADLEALGELGLLNRRSSEMQINGLGQAKTTATRRRRLPPGAPTAVRGPAGAVLVPGSAGSITRAGATVAGPAGVGTMRAELAVREQGKALARSVLVPKTAAQAAERRANKRHMAQRVALATRPRYDGLKLGKTARAAATVGDKTAGKAAMNTAIDKLAAAEHAEAQADGTPGPSRVIERQIQTYAVGPVQQYVRRRLRVAVPSPKNGKFAASMARAQQLATANRGSEVVSEYTKALTDATATIASAERAEASGNASQAGYLYEEAKQKVTRAQALGREVLIAKAALTRDRIREAAIRVAASAEATGQPAVAKATMAAAAAFDKKTIKATLPPALRTKAVRRVQQLHGLDGLDGNFAGIADSLKSAVKKVTSGVKAALPKVQDAVMGSACKTAEKTFKQGAVAGFSGYAGLGATPEQDARAAAAAEAASKAGVELFKKAAVGACKKKPTGKTMGEAITAAGETTGLGTTGLVIAGLGVATAIGVGAWAATR